MKFTLHEKIDQFLKPILCVNKPNELQYMEHEKKQMLQHVQEMKILPNPRDRNIKNVDQIVTRNLYINLTEMLQ